MADGTEGQAAAPYETWRGGCHCGKVAYQVLCLPYKGKECNCSYCAKVGAIHHWVAPERFTLLRGQDDLLMYQWATKRAKAYFCAHCGIHSFSDTGRGFTSVNLRALEGLDLSRVKVSLLDGRSMS